MEKRKEKRIRSDDSSSVGRGRRRRGRKSVGGDNSKRSTEKDISTKPDKDVSDGTRKYAGLTCHQCKNFTDKAELVFCSKCIKKRYCYDCIKRWYPERTPEEVRAACPFCLGNCNCKACLREPLLVKKQSEKEESVKLKQLQYLLVKVLPVLRDIFAQQKRELEFETSVVRGVPVTESDITRCEVGNNERILCDLCRTFITNFHRSCQDPDCSCHICLSCCNELREAFQVPASDGKKYAVGAGNECRTQTRQGKFDWKLNSDGTIPCPPKELGGCGTSTLELSRLCECGEVEKLITNAEEVTLQFKPKDVDIAHDCSSCNISFDSTTREVAYRKNGHDNFLYSPNAVDLSDDDIAHFQSHWMRAEPVIVRNVLEKTSGLSWEPMVMWRACREMDPKVKRKGEARSVRAVDCLDLCEIEINLHQFFDGYLKGRVRNNGWPEMLQLKDWPPSSSFEERLPRHNGEFISALPFFDYTDPNSGILNLATRLRERFVKRNLGPKIDIAYGFPEELLNRGDSVTKLHWDITDSVNVLTHTAKVDITPWQYRRIKEEQKRYAEAQLRKRQGGQHTEASERENGEALEKCNGPIGEQGLKDKSANEEPSTVRSRLSGSQEGDEIFVSKGDCTNIERADPVEGSCPTVMESDHNSKADAGLIPQKNVTLKTEPIAGENYNDICLKTEILSPMYPSADGPTVENGLMMPTLPSTPLWDEEDSPLQPVVSTSAESIEEQKRDAPKETKGNASENSKAVHGGAVWDIFRREDVPKLIEYLKRHKHEFRQLYNEPVKSIFHPIHDQTMFLNESQKKQLKEEFDIEPWTFEQHLGEAVFIPAGCPHQVRNIQSCIKVALDFVSPESLEECLRLTEEFRRLPKDHRSNKDKLELEKIVLHAANSAIRDANKLLQKSMTQCDTYEACPPPIIHKYARRKAHMSKEAQQKRSKHKHEFCHLYNQPVKSVDYPILYQTMFLSDSQKKPLKEEDDIIEPLTFEQRLGEAVFILAGCTYQVRNRQIKKIVLHAARSAIREAQV
ncbi:unnamed protein product [Eruca vesicaria subsp. sativa]|uniref:Uncharacterized protein n=1 Tax=Eruca vesicaria subsp. sativa TaxID=29727 RepID=A0ABC8JQH7_ERUVS|nr:unnamed protein product [Eruca vesicaria subsp. sativa]